MIICRTIVETEITNLYNNIYNMSSRGSKLETGIKTYKKGKELAGKIDQLSSASSPEQIEAVANEIATEVEGVVNNKDAQSVVLKVVDCIDDSTIMKKIREQWNQNVPWYVKFYISLQEANPIMIVPYQLMNCGFLPYDPDPQKSEEFMSKRDHYMKEALNWFVTIGAIFKSELKVLKLLMGPINRFIDVKHKSYKIIRTHLNKKRELEAAASRNQVEPRSNYPSRKDNGTRKNLDYMPPLEKGPESKKGGKNINKQSQKESTINKQAPKPRNRFEELSVMTE
jgi:hypothetical protein